MNHVLPLRSSKGVGPCDFSVTPSHNWIFGFGTSLEVGLGGLDFGLGLDNWGRKVGITRRSILGSVCVTKKGQRAKRNSKERHEIDMRET